MTDAATITERMIWHKNDISRLPDERLITTHRDTELVYRMLTDKAVVDAVASNKIIGYQIALHCDGKGTSHENRGTA